MLLLELSSIPRISLALPPGYCPIKSYSSIHVEVDCLFPLILGPPLKQIAEHSEDRGRKVHNYKLLVDPAIQKGQQKLYRFDGVIPGDPASKVIITDPRRRVARLLSKSKQADLDVPQFKVMTALS